MVTLNWARRARRSAVGIRGPTRMAKCAVYKKIGAEKERLGERLSADSGTTCDGGCEGVSHFPRTSCCCDFLLPVLRLRKRPA